MIVRVLGVYCSNGRSRAHLSKIAMARAHRRMRSVGGVLISAMVGGVA